MTADSRVGLGLLVAAALLAVLVVDTSPEKWRGGALVVAALVFNLALLASLL